MSSVFPALMSLAPGARVLVAGGTGTVGSGVTLAALKQGAQVIVATRSTEKFQALQNSIPQHFHGALSVVVGDLKTEKGVERVFSQVTGHPRGVQHVVASIRGNNTWWKMGYLLDQSVKNFQAISHSEATTHFLLMKAFLPYLKPYTGRSYTVVTGYPGSADTAPGTPSSLLCLATGALHGLVDGAMAEYQLARVAINEVHLKCLVENNNDDELLAVGPQMLGQDLVGSAIVAVAASGTRGHVALTNRDIVRKWAGRKDPSVAGHSAARTLPTEGMPFTETRS